MTLARAACLFVALTAVMTWPQAANLATHAMDHQDVYFNMWRFGWFAHALATSPSRLLDGNIFYPEERTLTFSDAMPVECLIAAPLLWSGLPPVLVHNLMLLGGIVLSAVGVFVLARRVTGSPLAAVTAGLIFSFVPYRFDHYMHMELQWTVWTPWAFWALHRTIETRRTRDGLLVGAAVALQMLSSVYYGTFLALVLGVSALLFLAAAPSGGRWAAFRSLLAGGVLAAVVCGAYALPYLATKDDVGGRPEAQIFQFSAKAKSYADATPDNFLYGSRVGRGSRPERRLFPGVLPCLLAVFGLIATRPPREVIVYVIALAAAFEMSLGFYGYSYRWLYAHVPVFEALRAPARLGIYVVFFLAVLAAYGHRVVEELAPRRMRGALAAVLAIALLAEYWVAPLELVPYPNSPSPVYVWLKQQPRGVVLELPVAPSNTLPGDDPRHGYMSTFHWMPLLNGYSGFYPDSYIVRLDALRRFPSEATLARLRRDGLRYIILHTGGFRADEAERLRAAMIAHPSFTQLGSFEDRNGEALVFVFR